MEDGRHQASTKGVSTDWLYPASTNFFAVMMRRFERLAHRFELPSIYNDYVYLDQFAYREGHNSTMALIKCQHTWLKWLDGNADFVIIFFL